MVKVVAGKSARAVGCAAFTGTNAAAGAEHLVVDTKAIQASLAVVGGGAASTQWAVARGRYRLTNAAVANQAAVALAAIRASTAGSTYAYLARAAIVVAGAFWGYWRFAHAAVANFTVSAFRVVHARAAASRPASKAGGAVVGRAAFRL